MKDRNKTRNKQFVSGHKAAASNRVFSETLHEIIGRATRRRDRTRQIYEDRRALSLRNRLISALSTGISDTSRVSKALQDILHVER